MRNDLVNAAEPVNQPATRLVDQGKRRDDNDNVFEFLTRHYGIDHQTFPEAG